MIEGASPGNLVLMRPEIGRLTVLNTKVNQSDDTGGFPARARGLSAAAVQTASQTAAQTASQTAAQLSQGLGTAGQGMNAGLQAGVTGMKAGVQTGVRNARGWAAPRLEIAADFTTGTAAPAVSAMLTKAVAPRVAAALRGTAQKVSVEEPRPSRGIRPALAWSALAAAVLAGAGAVAALVLRRYRASMIADTEPDTMAGEGGGEPGGEAGGVVRDDVVRQRDEQSPDAAAGGQSGQSGQSGQGGDASVNGRISASGR